MSWTGAGHFVKATTAKDGRHPQSRLVPRMGHANEASHPSALENVNWRPHVEWNRYAETVESHENNSKEPPSFLTALCF